MRCSSGLPSRGRADDQPDVIRQRLVAYRKQTEPLLDYYRTQGLLQSVDGLGSPDEVFDRIKSVLGPTAAGMRTLRGNVTVAP